MYVVGSGECDRDKAGDTGLEYPGLGELARYIDDAVGCAYPGTGVGEADGAGRGGRGLLEPPLGGGAGTLKGFSSWTGVGRPLLSRFIVPVGACMVLMLEYGLGLFFFSLSGVASLSPRLSRLARLPISSYA